jgi:ATP-dependent protease Clp ATPase subunit
MAKKDQCSFCGKPSVMVSWLAGEPTRSSRICNECVGICLEVRKNSGPPFPTETSRSDETDSGDLPANAHAYNWALPRGRTPSCSFCGRRQTESTHLLAGPQVWICDVCVDDAASRYGMMGETFISS